MFLSKKFSFLKQYNNNYGILATIKLCITHILNKLHIIQIGYCYIFDLSLLDSKKIADVTDLQIDIKIISSEDAIKLSRRGEVWFFLGAVKTSVERDDICFAIFVNKTLAGSCWIATKPIQQFGSLFHFPEHTCILHRLHVHEEHRGKHLASIIKKFAYTHMRSLGFHYAFSTIEWTNLSSTINSGNFGEKRIGYIIQLFPDALDKTILINRSTYDLRLSKIN